jgi:hypothetical protein
MYVKEGLFSLKIHESTTRYLEPEKFLIPMFRKVTGSMFELAKFYEIYWKSKPSTWRTKLHRESFSQKPIPVQININDMKKSFESEFNFSKDIMKKYLPQNIIDDLENIVNNGMNLDPELWAKIVYNHTAAYKNIENIKDKYELLDSLKTLWIGRFVSYAKQVDGMDINEAEKIIQKQAIVFEENFEYLRSIY